VALLQNVDCQNACRRKRVQLLRLLVFRQIQTETKKSRLSWWRHNTKSRKRFAPDIQHRRAAEKIRSKEDHRCVQQRCKFTTLLLQTSYSSTNEDVCLEVIASCGSHADAEKGIVSASPATLLCMLADVSSRAHMFLPTNLQICVRRSAN